MLINEIWSNVFLSIFVFCYFCVEIKVITMWLKRISILNYKNLEQAELDFSRKMNCIIGKNGVGKTNLLDAVFYLSFCKSSTNPVDSQNILHNADFFVLQGFYGNDGKEGEEIYCGLKRKQKKHFKRNKKEYERLSDHIGLIPLVLVSPADSILITGGSEERRKFMDVVISQFDKEYLNALIRYNKALLQRNTLLKGVNEPDTELLSVCEELMAAAGKIVYNGRCKFVEEFIPIFQSYYSYISQERESVSLTYDSHAAQDDLIDILRNNRQKDRIMGYTLKGLHRDDLTMKLGEFPVKREGSQGQNKTFLIALKLAQYELLKRRGGDINPIVLLDDIFDKLDALRVEQIVKLVAGENFGQIFITDTNREHLDKILQKIEGMYKLFEVENGNITERNQSEENVPLGTDNIE